MKQILSGILFAIMAVACSKDDVAYGGATEIKLHTNIEQTSKAAVTGNVFPDGSTLGLFVYHSELDGNGAIKPLERFDLYGTRYQNVRAYYANQTLGWQFRFENSSTNFEDVFLIEPPTIYSLSKQITMMGYAPWIQGCTDIKSIPVTLGGDSKSAADIMWAIQNGTTANSLKPDGESKIVTLQYKHALSLLWIKLKCKHSVSEMKVTSITLRKKTGGATELYGTGKLNAINGTFNTFTDDCKSESITIDYTKEDMKFTSENSVELPFMIFPTEYLEDGDYILEFTFNGQKIGATYPIKKNDIKVGNETIFKQGYTYTFNFTFNNYMLIDNVEVKVDETWTTHEHELEF